MDYAEQLAIAEQHVRDGLERIARQEEILSMLKARRQDATQAEVLLDAFTCAVQVMDDHRQRLARTLWHRELGGE